MKKNIGEILQRSGRGMIRGFHAARPYLWVVLLTLVLNVLCFLPQTFLSLDESIGFPWQLSLADGAAPWWLSRANSDLFRIWGELWGIGLFLLLIRPKKIWWPLLFSLLIPLLLIFQIYYQVSVQLYGQQPYLVNDLALLREVVPLFLNQVLGSNWSLVITAGLMGLFGFLLISALSWDWALALIKVKGRRAVLLAWVLMAIPVLWLTIAGRDLADPAEHRSIRWISGSVSSSLDIPTGTVVDVLPEGIDLYRSYFEEQLETKPDVYWIFFESYGKAIAQDSLMRDRYQFFQDSLRREWDQIGWRSVSQYSNSPVKGGRSWLAFTSALAGFRLENHLIYKDLVEKFYDYPHVTRWFKEQGYTTTRVKTMNKQEASTPRNLLLADRFYGFDHWFQYDSIPYQGFKYDVFGGIPDQYGLNYAVETTRSRSDDPMFLFMITMSGHQPWFPPAPVLEDWHLLDSIKEDPRHIPLDSAAQANLYFFYEARLREGTRERYQNTVEYQFKMMDQFMRREADSNSIFVLIGDHQPPELGMSWHFNFSTPVHIVSRDTALLEEFRKIAFVDGLYTEPVGNKPVQHEALFSLFVTRLLARYGAGQPDLEWIPDGLRVPEEE